MIFQWARCPLLALADMRQYTANVRFRRQSGQHLAITDVQNGYAAAAFFIANVSMCCDHDSKASCTSLA